MKKSTAILLPAIAFVTLTAFARLASIFEQLKIAEQEAKEYILSDFTDGSLQFPYSDVLKKLALNKRSEAVKEIGDYIRKYTESAEFEKEFKATRHRMLYSDRPAKKTKDELLKEKIQQIRDDINTTETDMKSANAEMKKLYEVTLQQLKETLAVLENPANPKHKMYVAEIMEEYEENYKEQTDAMTSQEPIDFPATSRELVKLRLKEFLKLTSDIDWNAKLVESGRLKKFADPRLEARSTEWKRCFRAGQETITAARAYAQSWLSSLK